MLEVIFCHWMSSHHVASSKSRNNERPLERLQLVTTLMSRNRRVSMYSMSGFTLVMHNS